MWYFCPAYRLFIKQKWSYIRTIPKPYLCIQCIVVVLNGNIHHAVMYILFIPNDVFPHIFVGIQLNESSVLWLGIENLKNNQMLDPLGQAWQNGRAAVNKHRLCGSILVSTRHTLLCTTNFVFESKKSHSNIE